MRNSNIAVLCLLLIKGGITSLTKLKREF